MYVFFSRASWGENAMRHMALFTGRTLTLSRHKVPVNYCRVLIAINRESRRHENQSLEISLFFNSCVRLWTLFFFLLNFDTSEAIDDKWNTRQTTWHVILANWTNILEGVNDFDCQKIFKRVNQIANRWYAFYKWKGEETCNRLVHPLHSVAVIGTFYPRPPQPLTDATISLAINQLGR